MMLKCFVVYFAIGVLLTIQLELDDFVRWIEEDNFPMPKVILIAIVVSFFEPIAVVCGIIAGIISVLKRH